MRDINIAIDGPSGAGKGDTSQGVKDRLGYRSLDTGAMFRGIGLYIHENDLHGETFDPSFLEHLILSFDENNHLILNGENVEGRIRNKEIGSIASQYSQRPEVRSCLLKQQQDIVKSKRYVVDGRDIASVVIPNAELKIYLTASAEERARRDVLRDKKDPLDMQVFKEYLHAINQRDYDDMNREIAPLVQVPDAIVVDTTEMTISEQIEVVYNLAQDRIHN